MDKKELIERICSINKTAKPEFLSRFSEEDLNAYLAHLLKAEAGALATTR